VQLWRRCCHGCCVATWRLCPSPAAHVALQAGLLLAETEYVKQVESDIASYKGLLMGLFFMTVRAVFWPRTMPCPSLWRCCRLLCGCLLCCCCRLLCGCWTDMPGSS
jgi:hypothetical protein